MIHGDLSFHIDGVRHEPSSASASIWQEAGLSIEGREWEGPYLAMDLHIFTYDGPGRYDISDSTVAIAEVEPGSFSSRDRLDAGFLIVDPDPECFTFTGRDPFTGSDFAHRYCTLTGTFEFRAGAPDGGEIEVTAGSYRISAMLRHY